MTVTFMMSHSLKLIPAIVAILVAQSTPKSPCTSGGPDREILAAWRQHCDWEKRATHYYSELALVTTMLNVRVEGREWRDRTDTARGRVSDLEKIKKVRGGEAARVPSTCSPVCAPCPRS